MNKLLLSLLYFCLMVLLGCDSMSSSSDMAGGNAGQGGSLARFTIAKERLYLLSGNEVQIMNVANPRAPYFTGKLNVGWDAETLFPYEGALFIGKRSGMDIFALENPDRPLFKSHFSHLTSCDPVVVQNDVAYITLRDGSSCRTGSNELILLNVENWSYPYEIKSYPLYNPHGLGVDQEKLFVCDGTAGLKEYKLSQDNSVELIKHYPMNAYDVIPHENMLIVSAEEGVFQYNYAGNELVLLSHIPINVTLRNWSWKS